MHPLYQRLKEMNSDTFEKLCFHILKERHQNADIRHVEGAGGDQGIDVFLGDLEEGPVVWQCKSFPNGIGNSQKEQIRDSLRQVLKHTNARRWILCVSIDMDTKSHRWFQQLQRSYVDRVDIGLMQACDIVHELLHRATLRNLFFPQAILDAMELRAVLAKTGELKMEELAAVSAENVEQYVAKLKDRDARFNYEVVIAPDGGQPPQESRRPGLLVSVADERKTINVFARDLQALHADPLTATFQLRGKGVEKFDAFIRSGRSQELEAGEIAEFRSDLTFLCPPLDQGSPDIRLFLRRNVAELEPIPTRLTFGSGSNAVIYEYIQLHTARIGSEEIELRSSGDHPFELQLSACGARLQAINLKLNYRFRGFNVRVVQKFLRAVSVLATSGHIEVYDLRNSKHMIRATTSARSEEWRDPPMERLIDDAVRVADHYGVELRYPENPEPDYAAVAWLAGLIEGVELQVETVTLSITKISEPVGKVLGKHALRLVHPPVLLHVFDTAVSTGELVWLTDDAQLHDVAETDRFEQAAVGETLDLLFDIRGSNRLLATGRRASEPEV